MLIVGMVIFITPGMTAAIVNTSTPYPVNELVRGVSCLQGSLLPAFLPLPGKRQVLAVFIDRETGNNQCTAEPDS